MRGTNILDGFHGLQSIREHLRGTLPIYRRERVLTAAEVLALHSTPITIVPAKTGIIHIPVLALVGLDYNSAAYAAVDGGDDITLRYTNGSGAVALTIETASFLDLTADALRLAALAATTAITPVAGAALVWFLGGAVTTGDSPINTRVYYHSIPAAFGL